MLDQHRPPPGRDAGTAVQTISSHPPNRLRRSPQNERQVAVIQSGTDAGLPGNERSGVDEAAGQACCPPSAKNCPKVDTQSSAFRGKRRKPVMFAAKSRKNPPANAWHDKC
jgi:hypothetical protein